MDSILPSEIAQLAERVIREHSAAGTTITVAESCTGGLIGAALTEIAGSSAAFLCGYVTYSNKAKMKMLGVPKQMLIDHGAVSQGVAGAMAAGALERSSADIAVSISGVAGPGGGSAEKPVGTVMFGLAKKGAEPATYHKSFGADKSRAEIRMDAAIFALQLLTL